MTLTVPACDYKADASDPVDCEVARQLLALEPPEAAMKFKLRRLAHRRYEIDGRIVSGHSAGGGGGDMELLVCEDTGSTTPLPEYLREIASIAVRVRGAIRTLTFVGQENR